MKITSLLLLFLGMIIGIAFQQAVLNLKQVDSAPTAVTAPTPTPVMVVYVAASGWQYVMTGRDSLKFERVTKLINPVLVQNILNRGKERP